MIDRVQAVRNVVGPHEELAGRLGRGVRTARRQSVGLDAVAVLDGAVDLVRGYLDEADRTARRLAQGGLEQDVHADDARTQERLRVENRAVDV